MSRNHPPYPPEYRRQMVELVRAGRTPEGLAREFEPCAQAIRNEPRLLLLVMTLTLGWALGAVLSGSADSPLSWEESHSRALLDDEVVRSLARTYLGEEGPTAGSDPRVSPVVFRDRDSFGVDYSRGPHFLVQFPAARIVRADGQGEAFVGVNLLVDGNDGVLLAAFTNEREEWVMPVMRPLVDPEVQGEENGWVVSRNSSRSFASSVCAVLAAAWTDSGVHPGKAGQIVLRPRVVLNTFPKEKVGGELVSTRETGIEWIIHIMGVVTKPAGFWGRDRTEYYFSGLLLLAEDKSGRVYQGSFLP